MHPEIIDQINITAQQVRETFLLCLETLPDRGGIHQVPEVLFVDNPQTALLKPQIEAGQTAYALTTLANTGEPIALIPPYAIEKTLSEFGVLERCENFAQTSQSSN